MPSPARRRRSGEGARPSGSTALILAGRAFVRGRLQSVEIAIGDDGRIQSVGKVRSGGPRRDVGDAVILPAAVDLHVHLRDPGGPAEAETIATGTVGAALGGVTLVGEMPNTRPPVTSAEAWEEKARRVEGRAAVDVLLYGSPTVPRALPDLARHVGGFKLYLSPTTAIETPVRPAELPDLWRRLSEYRLPISVHAEDPALFRTEPPPVDPEGWNQHRPVDSEMSALRWLTEAPRPLRLNAAHVTTAEGVRLLREAGLCFEATPHHLLLSERSGSDARHKVNPPLRSEVERRGLWDAFRRGEIPVLASDHAPHPGDSKGLPFDRAPSGVPGVETMLPLMLAKARNGELDLGLLMVAACDRPARWLGQPVGRIAPGHRANLLVVDFTQRSTVVGRALRSPCGWSPFEGWEVIRPREHYRDGVRIVEAGEFVGTTTGRVVRPEFAPGEGDDEGSPTGGPVPGRSGI